MSEEDGEVLFKKKPSPNAAAYSNAAPQSSLPANQIRKASPSAGGQAATSSGSGAKSPTAQQQQASAPSAGPSDMMVPRESPRGGAAEDAAKHRRGSTMNKNSAIPPQLLDIQVSCRNLSSNSSVVALFEAKGNKSLEYVGHTEGIRHSHHPDFQTHLIIEHRKGTNQKVKFNCYTLPPVHTRVEEKMRIGSAYVYLDEIAANCGLDLLIDLVHGYNAEKDKNNAWLKSHLLIKARIKEDHPEEERLAKVRATSLATMMAGRNMKLFDVQHIKAPKEFMFVYRPNTELGTLFWLEGKDCPGKKVPENFNPNNEENAVEAAKSRALVQGSINLHEILAIYEGHQTQAYIHPTNPSLSSTAPDRCFSIILGDGSIDLECSNVDEREAFMLGIHDILTTQAQKERDLENIFKFTVKCRNLPPQIQEGGLFVALSSRASNRDAMGHSLQYEVVNKTGWLASSMTPDFPKSMAVPHVSAEQQLKFDLFHNSLNADDGVGTAIVVYKELREHLGQMVMIPLRNMIDPEMDALLQANKSVMLIECVEHGEEEEEGDEIAEEEDSDDESEEYYGQKLKKLREKHKDFDANGTIEIPQMPPPPPAPRVSTSLFNGYNLDKYAFNTRGCQRRMIFAAKDMTLEMKDNVSDLKVDTASSPGNNSTSVSSVSASTPSVSSTNSRVIIPGNEKNDRVPERMRLYWCKPGKQVKSIDSSLKLSDVTNVTVGKKTATLQRKDASKAESNHCCSLHWGNRTLDLVADSQDVRDAFVQDLVYFLLPKSKGFEAYGQCGTDAEQEYDRLLQAHKEAVAKAEAQVRARLAAMGQNPYSSQLAGGDGNGTAMPDLDAALKILDRIHQKGLEKLGLDPNADFQPSMKKRQHPDIKSSLEALDDIFSELDARFAIGGGGGGGSGTGGGTGDGVGPGRGGGNPEGGGGSGTGGGTGDGVGPGRGGGGKGRGRGGKGKGGGKGDGEGSGSDGEGGGGGHGKGRGGKGRGGGRGDGDGSGSDSDGEGGGGDKDDDDKILDLGNKDDDEKDDEDDDKVMDELEKRLAKKDDYDPNNPLGTGVPQAPSADFVVGNAPPPPPMGPVGFGAAAQARKIRQLHWDPLHSPEITNTIFFNLNKDAFAEGESELDELFANSIAKKIEQRAKGQKGISLIDSKRAYNIEIGTSRLKMTNKEMKAMIMALDPNELTEEKAQILLDRVPTLEELAILKKYTGPTEELGSVEQFFMMMATIPSCGLRLECHLFRLRFPEQASDLKKKLKVMFNACKNLTSSAHLKQVLEVILQVGNYMNAGTRKGNAAGFKLNSLQALTNTKSVDNKMTLLDFIVSHIDRNIKTAEEKEKKIPFLEDMIAIKEAVNYDWAVVMEEHRKMKAQLKKIQTIVAGPPPEPSENGKVTDKLFAQMNNFYAIAKEEEKLLTKRLKRVIQLEDSLLSYFGETKDKMNLSGMFSIFSSFTMQFEAAELNVKNYVPKKSGPKKPALDGGVIDPRLNGNFSSMLQGVKLKSKSARHLAGGYSGRKTESGQVVIAPLGQGKEEHVGSASISFEDFDEGGAGSSSVPAPPPVPQYHISPEFVTGAADVPVAPPPHLTLFP